MLIRNKKRKQGLEGWQPPCGKGVGELQQLTKDSDVSLIEVD